MRANPVDLDDLAAGLSRPRIDPRTWVSFGTVRGDPQTPDTCVTFDEAGQPLVSVLLHPDLVEVRCRVAMRVAGNGEAEWHPFFPNDEVIVVVPEGNFRAGCTIVGKLCNELDPFPDTVGNQDPSKNNFAFTRTKTPRIDEHEGPLLLRSSKSGGFLSIDDQGVVTLRAGNATDALLPASVLQMSQDVIGMQGPGDLITGNSDFVLQVNMTDEVFLVRAKDMVISIGSSKMGETGKPNVITVPDALAIGTGGNPPLEHAASTEAVANIISNVLLTLSIPIGATGVVPLTGASLAGIITTYLLAPGFAASFAAATTGPTSTLTPQVLAAIQAAFAAATPKPNTPTGQFAPGIGSPTLLIG